MHVLFVSPRLPEPARVGYQVRAVEQLRRLGARHAVTFVAAEPMRSVPRETPSLPVERWVSVECGLAARGLGAARAFGRGEPFQCGIFDTAALGRTLRERIAESRFDLVHVQLARLAPAVARALPPSLPRVIDLVDALSLNMRRRAERDRLGWSAIARWEADRMAVLERRLLDRWDHSTVVSDHDRDAIGAHPLLSVNCNGVDLDRAPGPDEGRDPCEVVFTGNLGYFPNEDAIRWLLAHVWPRVLVARPDLRLALVGARPSAALRRLAAAMPGVEVVGPVDDLAARLARAAIAVAPLQAGSGQPLKVLEAFAAGTPVVATPTAVAGLAEATSEHLRIASTPTEFADAIVELAASAELRARLARAARTLVESSYGWDAPVAALESIWEHAADRGRAARRGAA